METPKSLIFECFELNSAEHELLQDGKPVKIEPQVFDLLWYFASNAGRLLSKDDIIEHVWNGRIVSDAAISTRINGARVAIGDSGSEQRVIRTIPRRGFRFLAEVLNLKPQTVDRPQSPSSPSPASTGRIEDKPAIAIMPIQAIGVDVELAELAEGMRIDIQNALIKVSGLFLTAVGSVNTARDMEPPEAAKALGVRYLLTGQLRRSQDKLRLSIQLLDSQSNRIVLSERFDHSIDDTFVVLDEVAAEVLETLNVALVAGEPARVWHKALRDIQSLSIFYRGVSNFFKMNRETLVLAREDFERIIRRHPDLAIGYTWVALAHWFDFQRGWSEDEAVSKTKARENAEKAVALPDTDGQAHTVLSHVYLLEREFSKALEAGLQAVTNRPSCTNANAFFANVLHYCGGNIEALNHIRLALGQSPFAPTFFRLVFLRSLIGAGKFDEAEEQFERLSSSASEEYQVHLLGCLLALGQGDSELARKRALEVLRLKPEFQIHVFLSLEPYRDKDFKIGLATELERCGLPA